MKKWVFLVGAAVLVAGVCVAVTGGEETVTVTGIRLQKQRAEHTVSCTGVIEPGELQGVSAEIPCVIEKVLVEEGQAVKAGEAVAIVNKTATRLLQSERHTQALSLSVMPDNLYASADGIVMQILAEPGQLLEKGMPCVVVADRDKLCVRIGIPEKHLNVVRSDQRAMVSGKGLAEQQYDGVLKDISAAVSTVGNGTAVTGRVRMDSGAIDDSFRVGLTTKVKLVTAVYDAGLVVPFDALVREGEEAYVYLYADDKVQKHPVRIVEEVAQGALVEDASLDGAIIVAQASTVPEDLELVRVELKEGPA